MQVQDRAGQEQAWRIGLALGSNPPCLAPSRTGMGQGRVWQGVGPGRGDLRVPTFETFVGLG